MTWTATEAAEAQAREERTITLRLRCTHCGDVDEREVYEGEADPCTNVVDGVECLSTAVSR